MKKFKKIFVALIILGLLGILSLLGINTYVLVSTDNFIENSENLKDGEADYILILGAGLRPDGTPSPMLKERLDRGIELYKSGVSSKIIMSGDHENDDHDEVNAMKDYVTSQGIPSDAIYMDHAGISTYDSVYRAKEIFDASNIVIVTQKYHLHRAIHIAHSLGLNAYGVDAQKTVYRGQTYREIREILARIKDFFKCLIKPESTHMGDTIPVSAGGNYTNDKEYVLIQKSRESENFERYISQKRIVTKIENIIENYDFSSETCDGITDYTLNFSSGKRYGIEIYDSSIHITDEGKEIKLDEEDSKYIRELIFGD